MLPGVASDLSGLVVSLAGPDTAVAATDRFGTFVFDHLRPGRYALSVGVPSTAEGTKTTFLELSAGVASVPDLVFSPLGELGGTVTFGAATGNAGISVIAGSTVSGVTDDRGSWLLRNVPVGKLDVVATFPGWQSATATGVTVEYGKRTFAPDLTLLRAPSATGILQGVVSITGETSHDGVTVLAIGTAGSAGAITDASGVWSIAGLSAGSYSVSVSAPSTIESVRWAKVSVERDKTVSVEPMSFTPLGTLRGKVTLAGRTTGNAGIMVWVPDVPAVSTNDAGEYEIKGALTGVSTIRASKDGWSAGSAKGPALHWRETANVDPIELVPDPSSITTITGFAKLVGHTDHSGTTVSLSDGSVKTTTAADGSYTLAVLGTGLRTLTFQSKDGRYNGALSSVLLMPGGTASVLSGSTVSPIPVVRLVRGARIGRGKPLGLTPSGEIVTLVVDKPGSARVERLTTAGVAKKVLEGAFDAYSTLILSPDRRWLAHRELSYGAFTVVSMTDGTPLTISPLPDNRPSFTADSKWLGYQAGGSYHLLSLETGVTRKLMDPPEASNCALSPDVAWVSCWYWSSAALKVASTSGPTAVISLPYPAGTWPPSAPQWTADGRLVHWLNDGGLAIASPTAPIPDQTLFTSGVSRFELSPDGKSVLVRWSAGTTNKLYLVRSGSSTPVLVATDTSGSIPAAFSKDSSRLAWFLSEAGGEVWSAPLADLASAARIASIGAYPYAIEFLGSSAVVSLTTGHALQLAPIAGPAAKTLASPVGSYSPSPNGATLAFTDKSAGSSLKATNASGTVTDLLSSNLLQFGPWSSDSARFAARFGTGVIGPDGSWWSVADPTGATAPVPISWHNSLLWLSASQAIVTDAVLDSGYTSDFYPVDDAIWLASFP